MSNIVENSSTIAYMSAVQCSVGRLAVVILMPIIV